MTDIDLAYGTCAEITRARAKNFYVGIRLLPRPRRNALCAVYALARRIDDIGDGSLDADSKRARLSALRRDLQEGNDRGDPVLMAVADACSRYPIAAEAFFDLIDGVAMDVEGATYATFDDLVLYCRRVAGSIGRLSLGTFAATDMRAAERFADDLGVALQLTNILRDVAEDRRLGRTYLPAEDLARYGLDDLFSDERAFADLIRYEALRAEHWYERGCRVLSLIDRPARACVGAMAGTYHRLLQRIEADPTEVLRRRVSLSPVHKSVVAARALAGMAP